MDSDTIMARLRAVELFKDFPENELRQLATGFCEQSFKTNDVAVKEGDRGEELFIILEGEFQVYLRQESLGFEKELAVLRPGSYFGEVALMAGRARMASVRALTPARALVLTRSQLLDLVQRVPTLALAMCRGMAEYLTTARAGQASFRYVSLDDYPQLREAHAIIPPRISSYCQALAIDRSGDKVTVAMVQPDDERARTFLQNVLRQYRVEFVAASARDFERYAGLVHGNERATLTALEGESLLYVNAEGVEEPLGQHETAALLEKTIGQAIRHGSSDIHFEPGLHEARIRLRIDGNMITQVEQVPAKLFVQVISRLKVMSGMDITHKRLPQDGRFPLKIGNRQVEVRSSVVPCQGGEKIVLRLLDPVQRKLDLDSLIVSRPVALLVKELFQAPSGLLLVCGPTGSGKTTTLYAGLNAIWEGSQAVNIMTVEDPVEYQLDFTTQVAVNRAVGLDFPHILRAVLRQDPDVVLVGEMRDAESATIALEAATTGHLVLSSVHTDFALEAINRLRNLHAKPYLMASALRGIISQRLAPRLCRNCAVAVADDDEHVVKLRELDVLGAGQAGKLRRGRGCQLCRGLGELGRVAVFEILHVTPQLRNLIEHNASFAELQAALNPEAFISLQRYGRFLLEEGLVAPERIREIFPARPLRTGDSL